MARRRATHTKAKWPGRCRWARATAVMGRGRLTRLVAPAQASSLTCRYVAPARAGRQVVLTFKLNFKSSFKLNFSLNVTACALPLPCPASDSDSGGVLPDRDSAGPGGHGRRQLRVHCHWHALPVAGCILAFHCMRVRSSVLEESYTHSSHMTAKSRSSRQEPPRRRGRQGRCPRS